AQRFVKISFRHGSHCPLQVVAEKDRVPCRPKLGPSADVFYLTFYPCPLLRTRRRRLFHPSWLRWDSPFPRDRRRWRMRPRLSCTFPPPVCATPSSTFAWRTRSHLDRCPPSPFSAR